MHALETLEQRVPVVCTTASIQIAFQRFQIYILLNLIYTSTQVLYAEKTDDCDDAKKDLMFRIYTTKCWEFYFTQGV